jgi:hypothetical protein
LENPLLVAVFAQKWQHKKILNLGFSKKVKKLNTFIKNKGF